MSRPHLPNTNQELSTFLAHHQVPEPQRLEVATAFAEGMVRELRGVLEIWEQTLVRLRRLQAARRADVVRRN